MCLLKWCASENDLPPDIVQILFFVCKYFSRYIKRAISMLDIPITSLAHWLRNRCVSHPLDCCASIEPATPLPWDDEASWRQCFWKPARSYIKRCFRPQPRHTPFNSPLETTISAQWRYDHIFTNIYLILFKFFVFHNLQKKIFQFLFFKNLWNLMYLSIQFM